MEYFITNEEIKKWAEKWAMTKEENVKKICSELDIPFGDCRVAGATGAPVTVADKIVNKINKGKMVKEIQKYQTLHSVTKINHIMKNGDYTTVLWADGTKTIVKKATDEKDDPEMALAYALLKKIKGNNASEVRRYFEEAEKKTIVKEKKKK